MAIPMALALTIAQEATGVETFPVKLTATAIMNLVDLAYEYGRPQGLKEAKECQHCFIFPDSKSDAVCSHCGKTISECEQ